MRALGAGEDAAALTLDQIERVRKPGTADVKERDPVATSACRLCGQPLSETFVDLGCRLCRTRT